MHKSTYSCSGSLLGCPATCSLCNKPDANGRCPDVANAQLFAVNAVITMKESIYDTELHGNMQNNYMHSHNWHDYLNFFPFISLQYC